MNEELPATVTLVVDGAADATNDELDQLLRDIRGQIGELAVDRIDDHLLPLPDGDGGDEPGRKSGDAAVRTLNAIDVQVRPSLLVALLNVVRGWVTAGSERRVELQIQQADQPITVRALAGDLPVVLKALAEYEQLRPKLRVPEGGGELLGAAKGDAPPPQIAGAELTADEIDIGGDVVGRDKVMSFGGHFIVAKEGAQVFIGQPMAASS